MLEQLIGLKAREFERAKERNMQAFKRAKKAVKKNRVTVSSARGFYYTKWVLHWRRFTIAVWRRSKKFDEKGISFLEP
jgi:hypothetical protein